jgi:hypothetical protein
MKISRRKILLIVWFVAMIGAGWLVGSASGIPEYGWAVSLSIIGVSLGVPLMRAFTEFSK